MKSDQTILEEAKEKVAKDNAFDSWAQLQQREFNDVIINVMFPKAALLSMKIKGEEMEKEGSDKELIEDYKKESKKYSNPDCFLIGCGYGSGKSFGLIQKLKAELSQAKEEKAKAFDEGVESQIMYWSLPKNCRPENPYTPKDLTQKK